MTKPFPKLVEERLDGHDEQIAEKATMELNELHVGANQQFKNVLDAINYWKNTLNQAFAVIKIHPGDYHERFYLPPDSQLILRGEDKRNTRIWYDKHAYGQDVIGVEGGFVVISNLTLESVYATDTTGQGCYALHIDRDESAYADSYLFPPSYIQVINCDIKSGNFAGAGIGTENDQTIEFVNCNFYSTASGSSAPGFLYHTSTKNYTNQKLILNNCYAYSPNGAPWQITNPTPNGLGHIISCKNITGDTDNANFKGENLLNGGTVPLIYAPDNYGNLIQAMNKVKSIVLNSVNNASYYGGDLNNCKTGVFEISAGMANAPNSTGQFILLSYTQNTNYAVQIAYNMLNSMIRYERTCSAGVWSAWTNQSISAYASDCNVLMKSGEFNVDGTGGTAHTPTNSIYLVKSMAYNSTSYILQYAWDVLSGMKKYKRVYGASGTGWGSWVTVTE